MKQQDELLKEKKPIRKIPLPRVCRKTTKTKANGKLPPAWPPQQIYARRKSPRL